jgi:hypothetical protein
VHSSPFVEVRVASLSDRRAGSRAFQGTRPLAQRKVGFTRPRDRA